MTTFIIGIGIWLVGWVLFLTLSGTNAWLLGPAVGVVGLVLIIVGRGQAGRNRAAKTEQKMSSTVDDFMN